MALILETGDGLANAESWASVAQSDAYAGSIGNQEWVDADQDVKEAALRRAVRYIIAKYQLKFAGRKTNGILQSLSFPRVGVLMDDGTLLEDDYIPPAVVSAQIEAAFRELTAPGSLMPDTPARGKKAVTVGPLSVTYDDLPTGADGKTFALIDGLLAPFFDTSKTGNVAFIQRA